MKLGAMIGIGIGIASFLITVFILVYFLVLRERFAKRQIRDLDRRVQFSHALLIGQDAQYVKRLEIISRTNLLYVDVHTRFLKRFKELRAKNDGDAEQAVNSLRDFISNNDFSAYKETLPRTIEIIKEFEDLVNTLNNDLLKVVKPEEDCRQSALVYKEQLRRIKQDYYSKESELAIMGDSFNEAFKYIDEKFEQFETLVESAQYDEANTILPLIDKVLHELTKHMGELPALCMMVSTVLPEKISKLKETHKNLVEAKYPLYHLCVVQTIEETELKLKNYRHSIRLFQVEGIAEKLEEISTNLDSFFVKFDEEKAARELFEQNSEGVYSTVNLIERNFIKLRNTIPEVSKYFNINEDHKTKINNIQSSINKVGALKRSLDTFIHSTTKQPYSSLVNKMNELASASDTIIADIEEFNAYISSLKSDAEAAYKTVFDFYNKIKDAEYKVRKMNNKKISEKYDPQFAKMFELLNTTYECLITSPIDIEEVNNAIREFYDIANAILDDGEVAQDFNMMMLAENAILFANRHRYHLSDVNNLLSQAETYFENGDFEKSYILTGDVLKKIKENNGR